MDKDQQTTPNPFDWQQPSPSEIEAIWRVRLACKNAYEVILANVPECAERTLAIRKLEETSMWANKAIVFKGVRYLG